MKNFRYIANNSKEIILNRKGFFHASLVCLCIFKKYIFIVNAFVEKSLYFPHSNQSNTVTQMQTVLKNVLFSVSYAQLLNCIFFH